MTLFRTRWIFAVASECSFTISQNDPAYFETVYLRSGSQTNVKPHSGRLCIHVNNRTVSRDFRHFCQKKLHLTPIWTRKHNFTKFFRFLEDIREKTCVSVAKENATRWLRSCWLRGHNVGIVIDHTDTMLAKLWTIRRHHVGVVITYTDTVSPSTTSRTRP